MGSVKIEFTGTNFLSRKVFSQFVRNSNDLSLKIRSQGCTTIS